MKAGRGVWKRKSEDPMTPRFQCPALRRNASKKCAARVMLSNRNLIITKNVSVNLLRCYLLNSYEPGMGKPHLSRVPSQSVWGTYKFSLSPTELVSQLGQK